MSFAVDPVAATLSMVFGVFGVVTNVVTYRLTRSRQPQVSRALESLDSENVLVRIEALNKLKQVLVRSKQTRQLIVDIIADYARRWSDRGPEAGQRSLSEDLKLVVNVLRSRQARLHAGRPLDLNNVVLDGADFRKACLVGCSLLDAKMRKTILTNSDLTGALLWGADLTGADLRQTNLTGTDLTGCDLRSANLGGAYGLRKDQLADAIWDTSTQVKWTTASDGSETGATSRRTRLRWLSHKLIAHRHDQTEVPSAHTASDIRSGQWSKWTRIGSATTLFPAGTPITPSRWRQDIDHQDLFAVGSNGGVYSTWQDPRDNDGQWNNWFRVGTGSVVFPLMSSVAVVSRKRGQFDIFVVDSNGRVSGNWWNHDKNYGQWNQWFRVGDSSQRFPQGSGVAVTSSGPDQLSVFSITNQGRLAGAWWDEQRNHALWSGWVADHRSTSPVLPQRAALTALAVGPDQVLVVTMDQFGTGFMAEWTENGATVKWSDVGASHRFPQRSPLSGVELNGGVHIFVVGFDGRVYSNVYDSGLWGGWFVVGEAFHDFPQESRITSIVTEGRTIRLYGIAVDGSAHWAARNSRTGLWEGWYPIPEPGNLARGGDVSAAYYRQDFVDMFAVAADGAPLRRYLRLPDGVEVDGTSVSMKLPADETVDVAVVIADP